MHTFYFEEACASSEENGLLGHLGQFLGLGSLGYVFGLSLFWWVRVMTLGSSQTGLNRVSWQIEFTSYFLSLGFS